MADAHDKLIKQFESATREVVDLTVRLTEARAKCDTLRKQLRTALRNGHAETSVESAPDADADGASSEAVMDAVRALRTEGLPTDAKRLGEILGIPTSVARTRLQRGAKAKLLRRLSRGKYAAEPAPVET